MKNGGKGIIYYHIIIFTHNTLKPRLRSLLVTEEEEYISEMISKQETTLEKQARMREKARKLKERREEERLALVEKKLDQRWR